MSSSYLPLPEAFGTGDTDGILIIIDAIEDEGLDHHNFGAQQMTQVIIQLGSWLSTPDYSTLARFRLFNSPLPDCFSAFANCIAYNPFQAIL